MEIKEKFWFRVLFGYIGAVFATFVFLLLLAAVAYFLGGDEKLVAVFNVCVRLFASGVCSYIIADGQRALLRGVISGGTAFSGVYPIFCIFKGGWNIADALVNLLFITIFCIIFSIIFVNFKKSRYN